MDGRLVETTAKGIFTGIAYGHDEKDWDNPLYAEARKWCLGMAQDALTAAFGWLMRKESSGDATLDF